VRLRQGAYNDTTVYDADPVAVAEQFVAAGATRIHLVDLDAARGNGDNRAVIGRIRSAVGCVLEVGGGIRDLAAVESVLAAGVDYAVVGTVLARDPDSVAAWAARYGAQMLASIDARDGMVRVAGWEEETAIAATDLARRAGEMGLAAVEYTNIARDGMLTGPDIAGTREVAAATAIPVILSGGVAQTSDAANVARVARGEIAGLIVGRAIYEGHFDIAQAIAEVAAIPT
jgi:phosphoribosylformimino-5-aminoimidazole carboxamide ribotide isomerase